MFTRCPSARRCHIICRAPFFIKRRLQKLTVDHRHQSEVLRTLALWHMIEGRTADRRQPTLPDDRQGGMVGPDHRLALLSGSRRSPCSKKSRSTVSSPILAWRSLIRPASASGSACLRPRWKMSARPLRAALSSTDESLSGALDDHELLGLLGIAVDASTLDRRRRAHKRPGRLKTDRLGAKMNVQVAGARNSRKS